MTWLGGIANDKILFYKGLGGVPVGEGKVGGGGRWGAREEGEGRGC